MTPEISLWDFPVPRHGASSQNEKNSISIPAPHVLTGSDLHKHAMGTPAPRPKTRSARRRRVRGSEGSSLELRFLFPMFLNTEYTPIFHGLF